MSSAFDLDFPRAPVQPIRPAATVIVVREAPSSYEIFMLKRTSKASFASGMYVFPGGRVDSDDHLHATMPIVTVQRMDNSPKWPPWVMSGADFGLPASVKPSKRRV